MPRLVISTVGTSLLTNQIKERKDPKHWLPDLTKTANWNSKKLSKESPDVEDVIQKLKDRVEDKLDGSNVLEIRAESAELNGIYGLYKEELSKAAKDIHYLIATDTAQGQVTAKIVHNFLREKGIIAEVFTPKGFSIEKDDVFSDGIDKLLNWFEDIIPGYKNSGYEICFNLVGGFKAIQGFANTIGMFYADKIIYIFENSQNLITIPRLPISIDYSFVKPVEFALMAAEPSISFPIIQLEKVPESLLFICGGEATLSNWGRLIWNRCKRNFLTNKLLDFPCLIYEKWFTEDYKSKNVDEQKKLDLHEVLANVSASMIKFNGNTTKFNTNLHFTRYEGGEKCEGGVRKNQLDHFYIKNTGWRVSCLTKSGNLYLRHYGEHDYVNDNP